jgi:predicted acyl esterase
MLRVGAFLLAFILVLLSGKGGLAQEKAQTARPVVEMVPMRDGVRLITQVFLPPGEGPWPVILTRANTKLDEYVASADMANPAGYVFVAQSTRGIAGSEGEDRLFLDDGWGEHQDGYDTIEWIAAQPWCNGKIGTAGHSSRAISQFMTSVTVPPHLVCQWTKQAACNFYEHMVYHGGVYRKGMMDQFISIMNPLVVKTYQLHPNYDLFWDRWNVQKRHALVTAPTVHMGGWFDIFSQGTLDAFTGLQHNGGVGARGNQRLLMGPWLHGGSVKQAGDLTFPENAVYSNTQYISDYMSWFGYWLKGIDSDFVHQPPVRYYTMGDVSAPDAPGNVWRTAGDWPPGPYTETQYFLHAGKTLDRSTPQNQEPSLSYDYDPANPVPTIPPGRQVAPLHYRMPIDQRFIEGRPDMVVFSTLALDEPVEVTGRVTCHLWASSSAPDTDWVVKLTDVYPDGRSILIMDGALRARHRVSIAGEDFLEPGKPYEFVVDLWSTSIILNKGHRIRVIVTSSNDPRFDPNPNTGHPFRADNERAVARNTIYMDGAHPSYILLPIPTGGLPNGSGR